MVGHTIWGCADSRIRADVTPPGRRIRLYKDSDGDERRTSDTKSSRRDLKSQQAFQNDEHSTEDRYSEGWEEVHPAGSRSLAVQSQATGSTIDQLGPGTYKYMVSMDKISN